MQLYTTRYRNDPGKKPYIQAMFVPLSDNGTHTEEDLEKALASVEDTLRLAWGLSKRSVVRNYVPRKQAKRSSDDLVSVLDKEN